MKFMKSFIFSACILSVSANANLIINGSFEQTSSQLNLAIPPVSTPAIILGNTLADIGSVSNTQQWGVFAALPGWSTVNSAGVEVQYNGTGGRNADDGLLFLELDTHTTLKTGTISNTNGGIFQDITGLTIGQLYDFSFAYMGRSATQGSNDLFVSWKGTAGTSDRNITFVGNPKSFTWSTFNSQFIASDTSMRLQFDALGAMDGKGALIDNVSLTSVNVPEPDMLALMLLGLGGFVFRKKS